MFVRSCAVPVLPALSSGSSTNCQSDSDTDDGEFAIHIYYHCEARVGTRVAGNGKVTTSLSQLFHAFIPVISRLNLSYLSRLYPSYLMISQIREQLMMDR